MPNKGKGTGTLAIQGGGGVTQNDHIAHFIDSLNRAEDEHVFQKDVVEQFPSIKNEYEAICPERFDLTTMRKLALSGGYSAKAGGGGVVGIEFELLRRHIGLMADNCLTYNATAAPHYCAIARSFKEFALRRLEEFEHVGGVSIGGAPPSSLAGFGRGGGGKGGGKRLRTVRIEGEDEMDGSGMLAATAQNTSLDDLVADSQDNTASPGPNADFSSRLFQTPASGGSPAAAASTSQQGKHQTDKFAFGRKPNKTTLASSKAKQQQQQQQQQQQGGNLTTAQRPAVVEKPPIVVPEHIQQMLLDDERAAAAAASASTAPATTPAKTTTHLSLVLPAKVSVAAFVRVYLRAVRDACEGRRQRSTQEQKTGADEKEKAKSTDSKGEKKEEGAEEASQPAVTATVSYETVFRTESALRTLIDAFNASVHFTLLYPNERMCYDTWLANHPRVLLSGVAKTRTSAPLLQQRWIDKFLFAAAQNGDRDEPQQEQRAEGGETNDNNVSNNKKKGGKTSQKQQQQQQQQHDDNKNSNKKSAQEKEEDGEEEEGGIDFHHIFGVKLFVRLLVHFPRIISQLLLNEAASSSSDAEEDNDKEIAHLVQKQFEPVIEDLLMFVDVHFDELDLI